MEILKRITAFFMSLIALLGGVFMPRDKNPQAALEPVFSFQGFAGVSGDSMVFSADNEADVNTAVLRENGSSVKGFMLEALVDGEYVVLTKGDTVNAYRLCAFDSVTAKAFRLTVTDCVDGFSFSSIELCRSDKTAGDSFRVVSYFVADGIDAGYVPDEGRFKTSTDIIVFGIAVFDEKANITLKNTENVAAVMEKIRRINPDVRIHLNLLGPSGTGDTWEAQMEDCCDKHISAMRTHRHRFISGITDILDEYGFDGVYFDWEYPTTKRAMREFGYFAVALDCALGEKELGAALSSWCCGLSSAGRNAFDSIEIMAYDAFDDFGYHASFTSAYKAVESFLAAGFDKEKLHLGLAYYARPLDKGAYWFNYNTYAQQLGEYGNLLTVNYDGKEMPSYFNSKQLVRDKTQYALDAGLGGVMIWHLACDTDFENDLSLYRTISEITEK